MALFPHNKFSLILKLFFIDFMDLIVISSMRLLVSIIFLKSLII